MVADDARFLVAIREVRVVEDALPMVVESDAPSMIARTLNNLMVSALLMAVENGAHTKDAQSPPRDVVCATYMAGGRSARFWGVPKGHREVVSVLSTVVADTAGQTIAKRLPVVVDTVSRTAAILDAKKLTVIRLLRRPVCACTTETSAMDLPLVAVFHTPHKLHIAPIHSTLLRPHTLHTLHKLLTRHRFPAFQLAG